MLVAFYQFEPFPKDATTKFDGLKNYFLKLFEAKI